MREPKTAPRITVIIPAGGMGTRLGARTPKQFLSLGGAPILAVTVRQFARHPDVDAVIVAAPAAFVRRAETVLAEHARRVRLIVVPGGEERQESVWRGLQAAPSDVDIIVVHDAVRPFVTRALIDAVVHAAMETGAAICGMPIADTVKRVRENLVETTVDRSTLWAVQTPQAFRASLLREAHDKARRDGAIGTDDAMLVERLGQPVRLVRGSEANVKITTPHDPRRARAARL